MEKNSSRLKLIIIGYDSSHTRVFAQQLLKLGVEILGVYDDEKSKLDISVDRRESIKKELLLLNIPLLDNFDTFNKADGFLVLNVDADLHIHYLNILTAYQKPIFIDKPITYSFNQLEEIIEIVEENSIPVFSSSSLRFTQCANDAKEYYDDNEVSEIILYGPLNKIDDVEGYFWYGIHSFEWLNTIVNGQIKFQSVEPTMITGSIDSIKFKILHNSEFSISFLHKDNTIKSFELGEESIYKGLIDALLVFFESHQPPIVLVDTLRIIQAIEKANHLERQNYGKDTQ